ISKRSAKTSLTSSLPAGVEAASFAQRRAALNVRLAARETCWSNLVEALWCWRPNHPASTRRQARRRAMFLLLVLLLSAGIVAASIFAGLQEEKRASRNNSAQGRRNRQRLNMAKVAGTLPDRKEN